MSVAFGAPPDTVVATPGGPRALGALAVGDEVWGVEPIEGTLVPARVEAISGWSVEQLVAVQHDGGALRGCTPGTSVWDAFEESFRAAGSLSTLSEVWSLEGGSLRRREVRDAPEVTVPATQVLHLTLHHPASAVVFDGVVVRHKERT